jgi:uncharacterized protein YyaL (SSP411 family)
VRTNRLASSNSPYLLQHAGNPVDWYPWGEEALSKARFENKPIFLSIGYAACHWCHVMAHESFEDPETAAVMNEYFVNIKVDREERPDLDSIYMQAVVAMTGSGGWPMSVFLTPAGKPFYGGTYFPPMRRYNMPAFREVLLSIARIWNEDPQKLVESSTKITDHILTTGEALPAGEPLSIETLKEAVMVLSQNYDWKYGGWGRAPKFPQPMAIEFLLRRAAHGDRLALDIACHALHAMAKGGMYDVVGGGFARYSTDDRWLVPHFEKMLYDNAQLALAYLHAYLLTGEAKFKSVCEETLEFVCRELSHPEGGFYSSLDADSDGEEGKFYIWTEDEIGQVLAEPEDASFFKSAYGITNAGNFEQYTVLQRLLDDAQLASQFNLDVKEVPIRLKRLHLQLLQARTSRIRPSTDDKVLVSWNALMLAAFAEAARYLKRSDYLAIAQRNARFLMSQLYVNGRLLRSWREGKAAHNAYLEDHAALIIGLLSLYQSDADLSWFEAAKCLTNDLLQHFTDPAGDFFDTRDDHEALINRPKDLQDNATPSGNALAATAILQMSAYTGRGEWRSLAEAALQGIQNAARQYPTAFSCWLSAIDFALAAVQEVAILGNPEDADRQALVDCLWSDFRPHLMAAISNDPPSENAPELLHGRMLKQGKATAFVCRNFTCQLPVTQPDEFAKQLSA